MSEFKDYKETFWCPWGDTMHYPKLNNRLLINRWGHGWPIFDIFQVGLRSAATRVLDNYDMEGNPVSCYCVVE